MKKVFCFVLAIALLISSCAFAQSFSLKFTAKNGQNTPEVKKETGVGVSAKVSASNVGSHSMYYQVRRGNVQSSEYAIKKGNGSMSLAYKKDGNGESFGRQGYKYVLRVAHRSQCTCNGGTINMKVDFQP